MKKKKGFTLIELLAVIVLVVVLAGIAVPSVMKTLKSRKEKLYTATVEELKNMAKVYATDNPSIYFAVDARGQYYIPISKLCEVGYTDCPVIDPRNSSSMTGSIKISDVDNDYAYEYVTTAPEQNTYFTNKELYDMLLAFDETLTEFEDEATNKLTQIKNNLTSAENNYNTAVNSNLSLRSYPVGSIYISYSSTNPHNLIGGTWQAFAPGRVLVGVGTDYASAGLTGGSKTRSYTPAGSAASHVLTTSEIPAHTHGSKSITGFFNIRRYGVKDATNGNDIIVTTPTGVFSRTSGNSDGNYLNSGSKSRSNPYWDVVSINLTHEHASVGSNTGHTHSFTGTATTFNVMQPYVTVYMWRRTA